MAIEVSPQSAPPSRRMPSRRSLVKGAVWSAPVLAISLHAPAVAASVVTNLRVQARARLLSGAIGGLDLDTVAALEGSHAIADTTTVTDTEAAGLDVSVLNTLQLPLSGLAGSVSSVLDLAAGQNAGVVNQFAFADSQPEEGGISATGGAGAVNQDSGAITLNSDSQNVPELGTVDLYSLLQQTTGNQAVSRLVTSVSDLRLVLGAAAGRAVQAAPSAPVGPNSQALAAAALPTPDQVERDYLLAGLRMEIESDTVGDLLSALTTALPTLTISTDAVWSLLQNVPLLGNLLSALGRNALTVTATVNTSTLTNAPFPERSGTGLQLDLATSTLVVDLAAVLGGAYTGEVSKWLNTLGPNTRLFVDAGLPGDAVTDLLDAFIDSLVERLKDLITIRVAAGSVSGLLATGLLIQGTLRQFLEGGATASFKLAGVTINLGSALNPLLKGIGDLVESTLRTLLRDNFLVDAAMAELDGILLNLFDVLSGVLAITMNAQNDASGTVPSYFQGITPEGRFDVAAVHLEILGVANLLNLALARGSVGESTLLP